jgi:hypothetical protein
MFRLPTNTAMPTFHEFRKVSFREWIRARPYERKFWRYLRRQARLFKKNQH